MRFAVRAAGVSEVPVLEELWDAMVEHHRRLVAGQGPVLAADGAWERRRGEYHAWPIEESGFIFIARAED